jgi:hypothetical protein
MLSDPEFGHWLVLAEGKCTGTDDPDIIYETAVQLPKDGWCVRYGSWLNGAYALLLVDPASEECLAKARELESLRT